VRCVGGWGIEPRSACPYFDSRLSLCVPPHLGQVDIYSLAIVMAEMINRRPPWHGSTGAQVAYEVHVQGRRPPLPPPGPLVPVEFLDIIKAWACGCMGAQQVLCAVVYSTSVAREPAAAQTFP
jgi:hypothetical protein